MSNWNEDYIYDFVMDKEVDMTKEEQTKTIKAALASAWKDKTSEPTASAWDTQEGGSHYKDMGIQPMHYSMANGLDALQHTAIKYISRFRDKNGIADLMKAKHCIDMLIEWEAEDKK